MALVHVAMFDAVNAIDRSYEPYAAHVKASRGASMEAAAAQAAHDTLAALYPARLAVFDAALAEDLAGIPHGRARQGIAIGKEVAEQILELRSDDGASAVVGYAPPSNDAGQWHPTLPDFTPSPTGHVPLVTPFAIESSDQFRPAPPPALGSPEYATGFNEAKLLGAADAETADRDGNGLPDRTAEQTETAMLWRLPLTHHQVWNRIAQDVAEAQDSSLVENARAFALLNMAFHDGLQTSFESKYHYGLWRPVEAIRRAAEDGNAATDADPAWTPLHPSTPPYPTYAGNAATIGAASATVLSEVFGSDVAFEIAWGEYGFADVTRSYESFWEAADEEARSRIYGGIHFTFDSVAGQGIGANVGNYVVDNYLTPADGDDASQSHGHRLTAVSGEGEGMVNVSPTGGTPGFSAQIQVTVRKTSPNTTFDVKRAFDFTVDGVCTSDTFIQFPLPNPGPLVQLKTTEGGAGAAHISFERPQIADGTSFDVRFELSTPDGLLVLRTDCFTVAVK
jgi:hypothetical protein